MSLNCPPTELLLRLRDPELFDDPQEAAEVAARAEGCPDCQSALSGLEAALEAPPLPFDPADLLAELRSKLAERSASAPEPSEIGVRLLCGYCHDGLQSDEALYCASCLTPHHSECYAEHGRCVAVGCEGRSVVGASPAPAARRRLRTSMLGLLGALSVGALAAWGPSTLWGPREGAAREGAKAGVALAAPSPAPSEPGLGSRSLSQRTYPVSDLVRVLESPRPAWEIRYRKLLATRPVTLNFPGTPIAEVIEFLRDITGLNLTLAPGLKPDLSPKVHVRLRNTTLLRALDLICEEANFRWSLTHGTVYLQPLEAGERLLEPVTWPFDAAEQPAQGVALIAALRSETQSSWTPGTEVRCEKGELRVLQTPTGHKRVAAFLVRRRPPPPPAVLADAWFAPAPLSGASPAQARTRLYAMGLLEEGSLTVDGSVKTALESLRRSCPTPIRVDPSAEAIVANTSVSLVLTAVTFRDALGLVCASEARLVWEVDRRGVLVRSAHAPPLTLRLRRAAQRALSRTDERDLRLRLQSHPLTLNFDQTPLSQILDFLRGVTGIDYFVTRAARPALTEEITLRSKGAPLIDVLERILAPLRLGIDLHQGFVRIVPAVQATEGRQFEARRDAFRSRPLGSKALVGVDVYAFARALEASGPAIVVIDPSLFGSRLRLLIPADCSVGLALQFARLEAGIDWGLAWLQREGCFALVLRRGSRHRIQAGLTRLAEPCPWVEPPAEIARAWEQSQATLRTALTKVSLAREAEDLDALLKALTSATNAAQSRAVCYRTLATPRGRKYLEERANTTRLLVQEIEANHATTRRAALDRRAKHSLERKLEEDLARHHRALVDAPLPPDGDFEALRSEDARRRAVRAELRALQDEIARNSKDHLLRLARLDSTCRQLEDRLERVCLLSGRFAIVGALAERLRRGESLQAVFPKGFRAWLASSRREDVEVYRLGRSHVAAHGAGVTLVGAGLESGDRVLTLEGTPITDWLTLVEAVGRGLLRTEPGATLRLRAEVLRQGVRLEVQLALLRPTRER